MSSGGPCSVWRVVLLALCVAACVDQSIGAKFLKADSEVISPSISDVLPHAIPSEGDVPVTIKGKDFGGAGSVTLAGKPCTIIRWLWEEIECRAAIGLQADTVVTVRNSMGQLTSSSFRFAPPSIFSLTPCSAPTNGGTRITVVGSSFGAAEQNIRLSVDGNPLSILSHNHTTVVAVTGAGQGFGHSIQVHVDGADSEPAQFNYEPPHVDSISPATADPTSKAVVTVSGYNFGTFGDVSLDGVRCRVLHYSDESIQFQVPISQGQELRVTVTVSNQSSNSVSFSFTPPFVKSIQPSKGPTHGEFNMTLEGINFGSKGKVFIGGSECVVQSYSNERAVCTVMAGQGAGLDVYIRSSNQNSNKLQFSYLGPILKSIHPSVGAFQTRTVVTIQGQHFGQQGLVSVGPGECTILKYSDSEIQCRVGSGQAGSVHMLSLEVAGQQSNALQFLYSAPSLESVTPSNGPTDGGVQLTITGSDFGMDTSVTVNGNPCPVSTRTRKLIQCELPPGQGAGVPVRVLAAGYETAGLKFSYNQPVIIHVTPSKLDHFGGEVLTILGDNFGLSANVSIGQRECAVQKQTHHSISCVTPNGSLVADLYVAVANQRSTSIPVTFQRPPPEPIIFNLSPPDADTSGGILLTVTGQNFVADSVVTVGSRPCPVVTVTNTSIACSLPSGEGSAESVHVFGSHQVSNPLFFRYHAPRILNFVPHMIDSNGGETVHIFGRNFGLNRTQVTIGGEKCTILSQRHDELFVVAPPYKNGGLSAAVVVTVHDQSAQSEEPMVYHLPPPPVITNLTPLAADTKGGTVLTLTGVNFDQDGTVYVGGSLCPVQTYTDTEVTCVLPSGQGGTFFVYITVKGQKSPSLLFGYASPVISTVRPAKIPYNGGTITVSGSNLGSTDSTVTIEKTDCPILSHTHSEILCQAPPGQGHKLELLLTVGDQHSNVVTVDYEPLPLYMSAHRPLPTVSNVRPVTGDTRGDYKLTIMGSHLNYSAEGSVSIGDMPCPIVAHDDERIVCTAPEGQGQRLDVALSLDGQNVTVPLAFDYQPPVISFVAPDAIPAYGTLELTVAGINFGRYGASVTVGEKNCEITRQVHTMITCTVTDRFEEGKQTVIVSVDGRRSNPIDVRCIAPPPPPVIQDIHPSTADTTGGMPLTVTGHDFGVSGIVTVGVTTCRASLYNSTRIVCSIPPGEGANVSVTVTTFGQKSDPKPFSYNKPWITQVYPRVLIADSLLTIVGTNLGVENTSVSIGGSDCPIRDLNQTELTCLIPLIQEPGQKEVVVQVSGQLSNSLFFDYFAEGQPSTAEQIAESLPNVSASSNGLSLEVVSESNETLPLSSAQLVNLFNSASDQLSVTSLPAVDEPVAGSRVNHSRTWDSYREAKAAIDAMVKQINNRLAMNSTQLNSSQFNSTHLQ
eukprot:GILK01002410.1.p1 GENE.GILK01002410.1~~GILK01002410.1.p1  ORF type:complete len:1406 (-),score=292.87 GILK01002410.1:174-4391(-)